MFSLKECADLELVNQTCNSAPHLSDLNMKAKAVEMWNIYVKKAKHKYHKNIEV